MVDAVKMDVEEQSDHLADSEVARLLAVLQNAEFKRSETRNITRDHSFKPRSLMEIAIEAQQRDAEIEAVKQAEESLAAAQRAEGALASKAQAGEDQNFDEPVIANLTSANLDLDNQNSSRAKNDGASLPADDSENARRQTASPDSPPSPIIGATPNVTPDMGSDDASSDVSGDPANDTLANNAAEHDPIANNSDGDAAPAAQIANNFETVTAAFERGKAEGMIAGRDAGIAETKALAEAAAQANLADKIVAFEAALMALAKPQVLQAENLSRSIHAAILKLASQLAGQKIDEISEHFLARIEALVGSIGQNITAGKVYINADDYKAMLPHLTDAHFDFVAEPDLERGDIVLKFAGVELHDIAETRLGGQYAETSNSVVEAPLEAVGLDLERKSTGPVPLEAQALEAQALEAQALEAQPSEKAQAESALKIRPMTTVRPLEGDNDASDNAQDNKSLPAPNETSS